MSFSEYPEFRPLELSDLEAFNRVLKASPPVISELTFTNLYSWKDVYNPVVAVRNGFLLVCSDRPPQKKFFIPAGCGNIKPVMEDILKEKNNIFFRVPEEVKELFKPGDGLRIEPDADNSDYLFKASDLIDLPGRKYDGKRNLIKKFKMLYNYEYLKLDSSHAAECFEFEEEWCSARHCDSAEGLFEERRAVRRMIDHCHEFGLAAGGIRVEGRICALAIAQRLNSNTLVLHVLKANPTMPGLYQIICREFLANEAAGYEFVNMEQDLGVEGLRRSKMSYHPVRMIRKYTISRGEV